MLRIGLRINLLERYKYLRLSGVKDMEFIDKKVGFFKCVGLRTLRRRMEVGLY